MKKFGFTLAEVLITMTIIGVVAALTTPALFHNANNAHVGPTLAKIKATIENANQQMMQDEEVGRLSTLFVDVSDNRDCQVEVHDRDIINRYLSLLSRYMRFEQSNQLLRENKKYKIFPYNGDTPLQSIRLSRVEFVGSDGGENNGGLTFTVDQNNGIITSEGATLWFCFTNFLDFYTMGNNTPIFNANNEAMILVDINGLNGQPNRVGKDIFAFIMMNSGMLVPFGEYQRKSAKFRWQAMCNPDNDPPVATSNAQAGLACTATIFNNGLRVTYDE